MMSDILSTKMTKESALSCVKLPSPRMRYGGGGQPFFKPKFKAFSHFLSTKFTHKSERKFAILSCKKILLCPA